MKSRLLLLLTFLLSFCSLSYQFVMVRLLEQFTLDEILSQSVTLGVYLLFMGLGAAVCARFSSEKILSRLLQAEIFLALIGSLLVPLAYGSYTFLSVFASSFFESKVHTLGASLKVVLFFQLFTAVIGFLSGFEIPCLQTILSRTHSRASINLVLGWNYLGALVSSFVFALVLVPRLNLGAASVLIGCLNLLVVIALAFLQIPRFSRLLGVLFQVAVVLGAIGLNAKVLERVEQIYLKAYYLEVRQEHFSFAGLSTLLKFLGTLPPVERYITPYQTIDITPKSWGYNEYLKSDFTLYLNMQPQFSESSITLYHQTMAHGGLNLAGHVPKKVLILGAGDGMLVHELLRYPQIEEITLVELDPMMIQLALEHEYFIAANHRSLTDPRVHVVLGDAYAYLRLARQTFEAIFVDFPFPNNYELGKLFSREFYQLLRDKLSADGFAVLDAPIMRFDDPQFLPKPLPQSIVISTLRAAGFHNAFFFGPVEPFVFVSKQDLPAQFHYEALPDFVEDRVRLNLTNLNHVLNPDEMDEKAVNSIYKPLRFR